MTKEEIFKRLVRDRKRTMLLEGRYVLPVKKDTDYSTFRTEREDGVVQSQSTPNFPRFETFLKEKIQEEKQKDPNLDESLFSYIPEFTVIVKEDLFKRIFKYSPDVSSWRFDALFYKLFLIFEADSATYHSGERKKVIDEQYDIKRDRYVKYEFDCDTCRAELGALDESVARSRFEEVWSNSIFPAYKTAISNRKLRLREEKKERAERKKKDPKKQILTTQVEDHDPWVYVDFSEYIVSKFVKENTTSIDLYEKYIEPIEPHYRMSTLTINVGSMSKADQEKFSSDIEKNLRSFIKYMFDKDLKVIKP
jgi:hypothetical protein